jgi:hypothetical protein
VFGFPHIASSTERLSIGSVPDSSVKDRDDVVQFQILSGFAVSASLFHPFLLLKFRPCFAMALDFWRLSVVMVYSSWKACKHLLSMLSPVFLRGFRNAFLCLFCMLVALGELVGFEPRLDLLDSESLIGSGFSPSGVVLSGLPLDFAFLGAGLPGLTCPDLGFVSEEALTADSAVEPNFLTHWYASIENRLNSGDLPSVHARHYSMADNPEPSLWGNSEEGATVMGCGYSFGHANNSRTNSRAERRDMTWTAWQHAEDGFKRPIGNKRLTLNSLVPWFPKLVRR